METKRHATPADYAQWGVATAVGLVQRVFRMAPELRDAEIAKAEEIVCRTAKEFQESGATVDEAELYSDTFIRAVAAGLRAVDAGGTLHVTIKTTAGDVEATFDLTGDPNG
jgi:hypothetical protein